MGAYINKDLKISIHAPRKGERHPTASPDFSQKSFQSTLPARGSDGRIFAERRGHTNFNPRSPQGGATTYVKGFLQIFEISIHAPRKGERRCPKKAFYPVRKISIHAPRKGERPLSQGCAVEPFSKFQSTLPARGSDSFRSIPAPQR